MVGVVAGCSSKSAVPCSAQSDCEAFAGTICANGFCRLPSELDLGSSDLSGLFSVDQSPPDMVGFCGGDGGAASCPASMPFCGTDSYCRACVASDAPACTSESVTTPRCDSTTGGCAACRTAFAAVDCPDATLNQCSFDGSCRQACTQHSDCASGMCDMGVLNTGGQGVCARADEIVYVNASSPCGSADGTSAHPFCALAAALTKLPKGGFITAVASGAAIDSTAPLTAPYVIAGTGNVSFKTSNKNALGLIDVETGGRLYLSGVELGGGQTAGLNCQSASVTLSKVTMDSNIDGFTSHDCTVIIEASTITNNAYVGANFAGGHITMTNDIVGGNTGIGVWVNVGATVDRMAYLTVASNKPQTGEPGSFACTAPALIQNSLVWGNTQSTPTSNSWSGACAFQDSDLEVSPGGLNTSLPPDFITIKVPHFGGGFDFVPTYHLASPSANNSACCFDKATPIAGITTDVDGDTRPKGAGPDIGADEAQ